MIGRANSVPYLHKENLCTHTHTHSAVHKVVEEMEPGPIRDQLIEWTHEEMSIRMLNHLLTVNNICVSRPEYGGLDETDMLFVRELVMGKERARTFEDVRTVYAFMFLCMYI